MATVNSVYIPPLNLDRDSNDNKTMTTPIPPSRRIRPVTAKSIRITEHASGLMNPDPITTHADADILLEDYLSPRKLRELTGMEDLDEVRYLEMKVDTSDTSLGNFGVSVPNMVQLKLSDSLISSIRDLGSSLHNVQVLWMTRCDLRDVDGISSITCIRELYLAFNSITDISACSMLEQLSILDLEGNNVDDKSQIEFLALCSNLTHLTLDGNPVCTTPHPNQADPNYCYRTSVCESLPQLEYLDDIKAERGNNSSPLNKVSTPDRLSATADSGRASLFAEDWKLLDDLMTDPSYSQTMSMEVDDTLDSYRPASAMRPPSAALRQHSVAGLRPNSSTASSRLGSATSTDSAEFQKRIGGSFTRPMTAKASNAASAIDNDSEKSAADNGVDSSSLTLGGVVCGNPARALRARRKNTTTPPTSSTVYMQLHSASSTSSSGFASSSRPSTCSSDKENIDAPGSAEQETEADRLFKDIQDWKIDFAKRSQDIKSSKKTQILTIDPDDRAGLTDSDSAISDNEITEESDTAFDAQCTIVKAGSENEKPNKQLYLMGGGDGLNGVGKPPTRKVNGKKSGFDQKIASNNCQKKEVATRKVGVSTDKKSSASPVTPPIIKTLRPLRQVPGDFKLKHPKPGAPLLPSAFNSKDFE